MLSIGLIGSKLKLNLLNGSKSDKDRLKLITTKIPVYGVDSEGDEIIKHWELPKSSLKDILTHWNKDELEVADKAKHFFVDFTAEITHIDKLDQISQEGWVFKRQPKHWQLPYIFINRSKTRLLACLGTGCGKSLTGLERARVVRKNKSFKLLVICPKTLMQNWKTEVRLTYDKPSSIFWAIGEAKRAKLFETIKNDQIIITSYQMAKFVNLDDIDEIIIDEAHLIKNETTDRSKSCVKIVNMNKTAGLQLLTGTPIYNQIKDLYALLKLASPTSVGSKGAFLRKFEKKIKFQNIKKTLPSGVETTFRIAVATEAKNEDILHEDLKAMMYRVDVNDIRTYEDVVDIIDVEMTKKQAAFYRATALEYLDKIKQKTLEQGEHLTYLLRLRMISEGLFNIDENLIESGKMDYINEAINDLEEGEKIVIWSCFKRGTNLIYEKHKNKTVLFNGSVSDSRKKLAIWAFQGCQTEEDEAEYYRLWRLPQNKDWKFAPGEASVFAGVISDITSIGINLQRANKQIVSQYSYPQTTNEQATARIRRIGQTASIVNTQYLTSHGSNDRIRFEKMLNKNLSSVHIVDGKDSISYSALEEMIQEIRDSL